MVVTDRARALRRNATEAEGRLWQRLRNRQVEDAKFARQVPIGRYVVDFACRSLRLVVEVDGGQHADNAHDLARTAEIEAAGHVVLRFWNHEVLGSMDGVLDTIAEAVRIARP